MSYVVVAVLSLLAFFSKGLSEKFDSDLIVEKIPEFKKQIAQKYTNLNSADIKFYNINYTYRAEESNSVNVFINNQNKEPEVSRIFIGFLTSDQKKESSVNLGKEISIPGVLVVASTSGEVVSINKGEFNRIAFIKMDGSLGEYKEGGFSNDQALRYKQLEQLTKKPVTPLNPQQIDAQKAHHELTARAQNGVMLAQYCLGKNYLAGFGCIKNEEEARKWLKAAADQGSKDARDELSKLEHQKQSSTNPPQNP
jgi:TPR repeat protein